MDIKKTVFYVSSILSDEYSFNELAFILWKNNYYI